MTSYRDAYLPENVKGPGDGRPTAMQVVQDAGACGTNPDRVILLTGSSSGIGIETARALAATRATLWLGVRDLEKAKAAHADILSSSNVHLLELDVSRLSRVRSAAAEFLRRSNGRLNVLINNAGALAPPELHVEKLESHMAVHYWGPFLLFHLLKHAMLDSSSPQFPSRVINVSSKAHQVERIDFDDPHMPRKTTVFDGYPRSRLAQVYMASEIERRYGDRMLHGYSLDPGVVGPSEGSGITRHVEEMMEEKWNDPVLKNQMMSAAQGAATTVWAAVAGEALEEGACGRYLEFCRPASPAQGLDPGMESGYGSWAYDEQGARRLWEMSFAVVGLSPE